MGQNWSIIFKASGFSKSCMKISEEDWKHNRLRSFFSDQHLSFFFWQWKVLKNIIIKGAFVIFELQGSSEISSSRQKSGQRSSRISTTLGKKSKTNSLNMFLMHEIAAEQKGMNGRMNGNEIEMWMKMEKILDELSKGSELLILLVVRFNHQ